MATPESAQALIVIDGAEYQIPQSFTFREMSLIKRLSGVRAGELTDAFDNGDTDVMAAVAIIAMRRAGVDVDEARFLDSDIGVVSVKQDEVNGGPPAVAADDAADK